MDKEIKWKFYQRIRGRGRSYPIHQQDQLAESTGAGQIVPLAEGGYDIAVGGPFLQGCCAADLHCNPRRGSKAHEAAGGVDEGSEGDGNGNAAGVITRVVMGQTDRGGIRGRRQLYKKEILMPERSIEDSPGEELVHAKANGKEYEKTIQRNQIDDDELNDAANSTELAVMAAYEHGLGRGRAAAKTNSISQ